MTELRIYVACLAAYNAGRLHGVWIEQDTLADGDETQARIDKMIAHSPVAGAEEYMIHDYEGPIDLSKYSISAIVEAVEWLIDQHDADLAHAVLAVADEQYSDISDAQCTYWEERLLFVGRDLAVHCEEFHNDTGTEIPASLAHYIDWEKMARDWSMSGEFTSVEVDSETYWFHAV